MKILPIPKNISCSSVQSLSRVRLFATPRLRKDYRPHTWTSFVFKFIVTITESSFHHERLNFVVTSGIKLIHLFLPQLEVLVLNYRVENFHNI